MVKLREDGISTCYLRICKVPKTSTEVSLYPQTRQHVLKTDKHNKKYFLYIAQSSYKNTVQTYHVTNTHIEIRKITNNNKKV